MSISGPPPVIQITGSSPNVAITTGDHSAAQAGTGQTAHVAHTEGVDLSQLGPLLQALAEAIGELSSPKARDTLGAHIRTAQTEAGKGDKPDPPPHQARNRRHQSHRRGA